MNLAWVWLGGIVLGMPACALISLVLDRLQYGNWIWSRPR